MRLGGQIKIYVFREARLYGKAFVNFAYDTINRKIKIQEFLIAQSCLLLRFYIKTLLLVAVRTTSLTNNTVAA
jgi:hypothetical protein